MRILNSFLKSVAGSVILTAAVISLGPSGSASAATAQVNYDTDIAGYLLEPSSAPVASGTVGFKVPKISHCTTTDFLITTGISMAGLSNSISVWLIYGCSGGAPLYVGDFNVNGTDTNLSATISAKDSLVLSGSIGGAGSSVTFTDTSTGFTKSMTAPGDTGTVCFFGAGPVSNTGGQLGVPNFGHLSLKSIEVNGITLGKYAKTVTTLDDIRTTSGSAPPGGTVQILPGKIGASSFTLTYKHS